MTHQTAHTPLPDLAALTHFTQRFVRELRGGERIGLVGPLGAGKTTFVQTLARELGITQVVDSPTFALRQTYTVPRHPSIRQLIHLDLYRLHDADAIDELGLIDEWHNPNNLFVIEWITQAPALEQLLTHRLTFSVDYETDIHAVNATQLAPNETKDQA